ncbi:ubinuclein-2b [Latimeria chalumnae]|uniref:ubinuclein-2b n=1 Tax=Latimeria chalumnae TaxID=7897 RepID=UPI00313C4DB8
MAEPRKVPFVTLAAAASSPPEPLRKKKDKQQPAAAAGGTEQAPGSDGKSTGGLQTVRLELSLSEPTQEGCAEFNYPHLVQASRKPPPNPADPFDDEERERLEVEALAKKFEVKYGAKSHKHRKDRLQDLIDIGYGYDETDPFIDNSEAYDELVPASLTTKFGGFYINTGTLQFRQASDSENEDFTEKKKLKSSKISKLKDGEERMMKKRKRKEDGVEEERKPLKMKVPKQMGVMALNAHKSEKKKKKLYKDSLSLAAMLRKFQKEKEAMRKSDPSHKPPVQPPKPTPPPAPAAVASMDVGELTLGATDPVLAILGTSNENELLQEAACAMEMLGDFDFDKLLDGTSNGSPLSEGGGGEENRVTGLLAATPPGHFSGQKQIPALPEGLPSPLEKRIGDLRVAAKLFDEEGRKKFFTQDMNNILLDIELQLQELSSQVRGEVYSHLEAFVPCNKDMLIKRLKKLHLNIQDDRLREPLQKLKLAVSNVMPEQLFCYQEDCQAHNQAKFAKLQAEEDKERNGSEEEDDDKPGKRIMGPRKKFHWDDNIRALLCNLVKIKLSCYELEPNKSQSVEDYLKAFMESEVKPLWPKGWMQARMLFKESRSIHSHLTAAPAKKKVMLAPKPKVKDSSPKKEVRTLTPQVTPARVPPLTSITPISATPSSISTPTTETIYLDDSLDEDLSVNPPSLDSISEALAVLNNGAKGTLHLPNCETPVSRPHPALREEKLASIMSKLPLASSSKPPETAQVQTTSSFIAGHSGALPKKKEDPAHLGSSRGLIAGSSMPSPKVPSEPSTAKLHHQPGGQRTAQAQVTKLHQPTTAHQNNYVSPMQVTISKSHTNPVVMLSNNIQLPLSSSLKTLEKQSVFRKAVATTSSSPSPSSGSSPQGSHQSVPRASPSPSTSTSYLTKAMGSPVSSGQAFKSPFSVTASPKSAGSTPLSSSGLHGVPGSHSSSGHHKQSGSSGGVSMSRQSPTTSLLAAGRLSGGHSLKGSQGSSKQASSASSGTVGSLGGGGPIGTGGRGSSMASGGTVSRTNISGGTGSGTQGAAKQLSTPHRSAAASSSSGPSAAVQSTSGASLLANTSPLALMPSSLSVANQNVTTATLNPFGMLGGLVPVTVPFQFPLELLGFGTETAGVTTSSGTTSTAFHHSLTQNLLKGLQPSSQHTAALSHSSLPAHLTQTYTDGSQSQGDTKMQRKSQ